MNGEIGSGKFDEHWFIEGSENVFCFKINFKWMHKFDAYLAVDPFFFFQICFEIIMKLKIAYIPPGKKTELLDRIF